MMHRRRLRAERAAVCDGGDHHGGDDSDRGGGGDDADDDDDDDDADADDDDADDLDGFERLSDLSGCADADVAPDDTRPPVGRLDDAERDATRDRWIVRYNFSTPFMVRARRDGHVDVFANRREWRGRDDGDDGEWESDPAPSDVFLLRVPRATEVLVGRTAVERDRVPLSVALPRR